MRSDGYQGQSVKLLNAAQSTYAAAFFFLPLSKAFLFILLALGFLLFAAGGGFSKAVRGWRSLPWTWPALVLAALPLVSLLIHPTSQKPLTNLDWLIAPMTFLVASQMRVLPWIRALLLGTFVGFCYAQLPYKGWWPLDPPSLIANYILYSQFLAIGVVLLSILYKFEANKGLRALYAVGMALFFAGLASGMGRTGMWVVLALLPFIITNLFAKQNRAKAALLCSIAAMALLMAPTVQKRIKDAVSDIQLLQQNVTQTSLGYRAEMWKTAWGVFRDHPLVGGGQAGFEQAWASQPRGEAAKAFVEPHNAFLFYASFYGVFGLLALLWLYAALLRTGWRQRQSFEGRIVFAFALMLVLCSFTNTVFMGSVSRAWVMMFLGLQGALLYSACQPAPAPQRKAVSA
jgi:O-antigen ligase